MGNKPPAQLVKEMHEITGQIVDLHGGEWTYNDGTTLWEKERTDGYNAAPCSKDGTMQFGLSILGPPVDNPEAAVATVKEHFLHQGFTVVNRFDGESDSGRMISLSMAAENGASFVYEAGTGGSGLGFKGECSTHPDMDETTK